VLVDREALRQTLFNNHIANSSPAAPSHGKQASGLIYLEFAARLRRSGLEVRLVVSPESPEATPPRQSQALLKAVARAHEWREQLITGQSSGPRCIAKKTGLDESYVRRILRLCIPCPGYCRGDSRRSPAPGLNAGEAEEEVTDDLG
jgi:hypothetical protein